jgi:hypothetical protein
MKYYYAATLIMEAVIMVAAVTNVTITLLKLKGVL